VMRVAYCLAQFPSGSETFLLREIRALRRRGFDLTVWALRSGGDFCLRPGEATGGVRVLYRPSWRSLQTWRALAWLCACRLHRLPLLLACVVHVGCACSVRTAWSLVCNLHAVAFFSRDAVARRVELVHGCFMNLPGVLALAVGVVIGRPFTVAGHARDVFVEGQACRVLARRAAAVVVCHGAAGRWLAERLDGSARRKLYLIRHGIDVRRYRGVEDARLQTGRPTWVLAAGRLVEKKGFDVLVRSWRIMADQGDSFRLVIAGDGPEANRLLRLVRSMGLSRRVRFTGWQGQAGMRSLLARAVVLVVPSVVARDGDRDGIPNVLLEACAARVPVVASRLPGIDEVVVDRVTGVLVRPGDPAALARALSEMLSDGQLRADLARRAEAWVGARFDIRMTVRRWVRLFMEMRRARPAA